MRASFRCLSELLPVDESIEQERYNLRSERVKLRRLPRPSAKIYRRSKMFWTSLSDVAPASRRSWLLPQVELLRKIGDTLASSVFVSAAAESAGETERLQKITTGELKADEATLRSQ